MVTVALTSTPWMTTEDWISVASFFFAYSAIRARTSAWLIGRCRWCRGRPLRHQLPLDLLRAGERGGVGGGLRVRAQHRGLADLEHQDADREQGEHARPAGPAGSVRVPRRASRHRTVGRGGSRRMGRGSQSGRRDRGSTFVWDSLGPGLASYLGPHEPKAATRNPPAHPRPLWGCSACSCSWRGTWRTSARRWIPRSRCSPSRSRRRRTSRSRTTWSGRRSCRAAGRRRRPCATARA